MRVSILFAIALSVHAAPVDLKIFPGILPVMLPEEPAAPLCFHQEDTEDHKCFEACDADGTKFATKGITATGSCPTKYNTVDTTKTVLQCPDGVTNVRYCAATALNVTIATKGEAGTNDIPEFRKSTCLHHEDAADHKCYEACTHGVTFKIKGLEQAGACPASYNHIDKKSSQVQCNDGVTSIKYCQGGSLQKVKVFLATKGQDGMAMEAPAAPLCFHQEDTEDHKCFEACNGDGKQFATKGITATGSCPTKYNTVDTTKTVLQCPDGVTNVRYCAATALNVTIATKGEAGATLFSSEKHFLLFGEYCRHRVTAIGANQCYQACASTYFEMSGVHGMGKCPSKFDHEDSSSSEEVCSDGKTNIKYCSGGNLKKILVHSSNWGEQ